ncbi:MAG TPA: amidohydrolase [Hyphomonadaceae bacterium]|mgnify:CR=1 FL=1|nr:amidohydrolase [Hyphomonadaceae bacterium]HPN04630.1 amidohydrolase [Hyphomonadaceae bacterium]
MKRTILALGIATLTACSSTPQPAEAQQAFSANGKTLRQLYEHLHKNPELSFQEKNTSAVLAAEMKRLGFTVTTGLGDAWVKARAMKGYGKVQDGVGGYGFVAVLQNGPGPTLMIRTDMDALPLVEKTGLSYASTFRDTAWSGEESGVMHACGHDIHMTTWIGTARELVARKSEWKGALVMIAQPAEEIGLGSMSMLEDGLFTRFPKPDHVIGLHDNAALPAGAIGLGSGYVMANVDSIDITVKGQGGHGAYPQDTKDPIVVAARIVTTLQTLVSREADPQDSAVVTVGAINGGFKHNIIPDEVKLQLTVRSFADATRDKLLQGIARIAKAEAMAAGLEGDKAPTMSVKTDYTPSLYNNPELTARLTNVLTKEFGADKINVASPTMGGEDFARFGRTEERIPIMLLWLGAVSQEKYDASIQPGGKPLPSLHSSEFAPDPDPTIAAGVRAMTVSALDLLGK